MGFSTRVDKLLTNLSTHTSSLVRAKVSSLPSFFTFLEKNSIV